MYKINKSLNIFITCNKLIHSFLLTIKFSFLQLEETKNNKNRIQQHCTSIENELSNIKQEYKKLIENNELLKIKIEVFILFLIIFLLKKNYLF